MKKLITLLLVICLCLTGCSSLFKASDSASKAASGQVDASLSGAGDSLIGMLPGGGFINQGLNTLHFLGFGESTAYRQAKADQQKAATTYHLNNAKQDANNFTKKWYFPLIVIAIILLILGIVIIVIMKKRKRIVKVTAPHTQVAQLAPPAQTSAKLNTTVDEVKRLCVQKGEDYDTVLQQCGSLDNAYYYLTTGRTSSLTPW